jgi:hypothetical protein
MSEGKRPMFSMRAAQQSGDAAGTIREVPVGRRRRRRRDGRTDEQGEGPPRRMRVGESRDDVAHAPMLLGETIVGCEPNGVLSEDVPHAGVVTRQRIDCRFARKVTATHAVASARERRQAALGIR